MLCHRECFLKDAFACYVIGVEGDAILRDLLDLLQYYFCIGRINTYILFFKNEDKISQEDECT